MSGNIYFFFQAPTQHIIVQCWTFYENLVFHVDASLYNTSVGTRLPLARNGGYPTFVCRLVLPTHIYIRYIVFVWKPIGKRTCSSVVVSPDRPLVPDA